MGGSPEQGVRPAQAHGLLVILPWWRPQKQLLKKAAHTTPHAHQDGRYITEAGSHACRRGPGEVGPLALLVGT